MANDENAQDQAQDQTNDQSNQDYTSNDRADNSNDNANDNQDDKKDYRGKLNATNRFLEKEGYVFEEGKGWHKPDQADTQQSNDAPSNDKKAELSQKDLLYLPRSDIHEDDLDEVIKHAKDNKVSVQKAHEYLKPVLELKSEKRKSADVSNTGPARRSATAPTGQQLLERAAKGDLPEDDAGIDKLVDARLHQK